MTSLRKLKCRLNAFVKYDGIVGALGNTVGLRATFRAFDRYGEEWNRRRNLLNRALAQGMYTERERRELAYLHRDEIVEGSGITIKPKKLSTVVVHSDKEC